ncbi:hypothetical protein ES708_28041 [subsurface metagenome]
MLKLLYATLVESVLFKVDGTGRGIKIASQNIYESEYNSDSGQISINLLGYAGAYTKFRNLYVGDGKGNIVLKVGGSASIPKYVDVYGVLLLKEGMRSVVVQKGLTGNINKEDYITICTNTSTITATLPAAPKDGERFNKYIAIGCICSICANEHFILCIFIIIRIIIY